MNKLEELQQYLKYSEIHVAIINNPAHLYYLSGFSGSNGFLLLKPDNAYFFTDPRYTVNTESELPPKFKIQIIQQSILESIITFLKDNSVSKLAITGNEISHSYIVRIKDQLKNLQIVDIAKFIDNLVISKNRDQLEGITKSLTIAEDGLESTISKISGISNEIDFSRELQIQLLHKGAFEMAFSPIVAWDVNSVEPHHKTGHTMLIGPGKLLVDVGAVYNGFYSDLTRMVYIGEPDAYFKSIYEIVRSAKNMVIDAIKPGIKVGELAQIIYNYFSKKSVEKFIGHYFGHGIGRKPHEPPIISLNSDDILVENSVIVIEPGLYVNNWGGIRIEDTVLVERNGARILNRLSDQYIALRMPMSKKSLHRKSMV